MAREPCPESGCWIVAPTAVSGALLLSLDTASHAGAVGANARASRKAGAGPFFMSDLLLATSATDRVEAGPGRRRAPCLPRNSGASPAQQ